MTVYNINYGHFDSFAEANKYKNKHFPQATIFANVNKYSIRVTFTPNKQKFDELSERLGEGFWTESVTI